MAKSIVAVIGLGAMGLPMATNLAPDFQVRGFDVSAQRLALAAQANIVTAASAVEAADGANVALLAVRDRGQLDSALYGEDGIVPHMAPGGVVILTSTVGIDAVREVADSLRGAGLHLVDAPVSGGPVRAGNGDLLVTVGADDDAWQCAKPVLDAMASTLVRVGDSAGDGQAMKTVNQLLCGVHIAAAGEAMALAGALGLDKAAALETLMAGAAASFMLGDRGARMLEAYSPEGPEVKSRLDIFVKDMGIVNTAARSLGLPTPVASAAETLFQLGVANGLAADDDSNIIRVVSPREGGKK